MKRAHEILADGEVDAHLAADGTVHLREERGGYLHQRDAAQVRGGGESGDVADHATAERDDRRRSIEPAPYARVVDPRDRGERLRAFTVRNEGRPLAAQEPTQTLPLAAPDGR